ncbi:hypothetical protein Mag101_11175 [Microbulbifer agarilyticus]|uniref:SnoaL-like domain-containing protein n=1 Tax=Microbulbifer agarilyticus TaxID=260552 RepID=A0A1Q2M5W7_9GAMM|nr:nuclear transport factor 2 family protein [Microbulbifer agarilyticus]AQQ68133.1 hypothetical protein Mag101_11175 [Microbulbifer agarilyticus]
MNETDLLELESSFRASYYAYAEGLDRKNWQKVRRCFADELYLDYGPAVDPTVSPDKPKNADEWVDRLRHNIGGFDLTHHVITNFRVDVSGELPSCKAYMVADHIIFPDASMPVAGPEDVITVIGEYTNSYQRIGGEWKILKSRLEVFGSKGNLDLFARAMERVTNTEVSAAL